MVVVLFRKGKIMQYNNEIENLNEPNENVQEMVYTEQTEKKESFFKKHGFFLGVLTSMICFAIVCFGIKTVLNMTGQLLVIGEAGASTIQGEALLNQDVSYFFFLVHK